MSDEVIVRNCSPTLAGIKTGNLFSFSFPNEHAMRKKLRSLNKQFVNKGLRILPLRFKNNRALIYVYRPKRLMQDLQHITAEKLLFERGYSINSPERCITQLIKRIGEHGEFPHEIGLFLGYPPEDVYGFIYNKENACKCVGCWKVYGDAETAQKTFAKYKKCTELYCSLLAKGKSIERLTVAG